MNVRIKYVSLLLLLFLPIGVYAQDVAGVTVPEQVKLTDTTLKLNGAGIRSKLFFDIYVGALYLPEKTTDAESAINMPGPKRVLMHFLYKEVSRENLIDGWNDGLQNNHSSEQFKVLETKLETFNQLFVTVKRSDHITLDYLPGIGTRVSINDQIMGNIPGEEFYPALLRVWLGKKPADSDLKKGMLGDK
ncbi:MAG: chalcone isomerase family protein [Gammaproteobacteria bacterium]|nr:chalcone isomerase family protein [Gammaproteobacteria bacterium]